MAAPCWLRVAILAACLLASPARADVFYFSTGDPDGKMAMASQGPGSLVETADDFVTTASTTTITSATVTGLLTGNATLSDIGAINISLYHVFPIDSGPPSGDVPSRVNSPADTAFASRDTTLGNLTFSVSTLSTSFTASNSVLNGIHPIPNQTTGGEGSVTGQMIQFNLTFTTPFSLGADHYFFVPTVQMLSGGFYWLSAPDPITFSGTPFPPGATDFQTWMRNKSLAPDWLRVGTDIVGGTPSPRFNAAFSLNGEAVPEPAGLTLLGLGGLGLAGFHFRVARRRRRAALG